MDLNTTNFEAASSHGATCSERLLECALQNERKLCKHLKVIAYQTMQLVKDCETFVYGC